MIFLEFLINIILCTYIHLYKTEEDALVMCCSPFLRGADLHVQ